MRRESVLWFGDGWRPDPHVAAFALKELTPAEEARIAALVKKAAN